MQNRIDLAKQLKKSAVPSSIVVTDVNNDQEYIIPGQDGEVLVSDGTTVAYEPVPISSDLNNSIVLGSDGKIYAPLAKTIVFDTWSVVDGDIPVGSTTLTTSQDIDNLKMFYLNRSGQLLVYGIDYDITSTNVITLTQPAISTSLYQFVYFIN